MFWTIFSGARLIYSKGTPSELFTVQRPDSRLAFCSGAHRYEPEAARAAGLSIVYEVSFGHIAELFKDTAQVGFRSIERQVSNIEFHGAMR